ncbi:MAG: family 10 glycosylhydrolase [Chthonomonadales bacterium]|nr:family 10 glycosylhydrolase [Chthonomonadales bacterium]
MRTTRTVVAAAAMLALLAGGARTQEIRAFWADAFNEGARTRVEIDTLLQRLRTAHCNAIFAQMRKGGDAYYQSRYDPWASDDPGRVDALAYLVERAHALTPRIQVHAWLNTCAVGRTHGNPWHIAALHPEWLSLSDKGEDYDREATKVDPGNPDAADWTARVYLDVLRHYDVDGVHFDFVRYGGANWGYNPVSVARFNARHGRRGQPAAADPLWKQWRRDQVTAIVRKVYALGAVLKPRAAMSAATITWGAGPRDEADWNGKSAAMNRVFQDWRAWMREGILDLNCLMAYYSERRYPGWFRDWLNWSKDNQYGRWAVPGTGAWLNTIPDTLHQIAAVREPSARGNRAKGGVLLYSYAGTNAAPDGGERTYDPALYAALSTPSPAEPAPPFAAPAEAPVVPWKLRPRLGHLMGFVLTSASLDPIDGARVTVRGRGRARRLEADGTGFWAAIDLPPGRYQVDVEAPGYTRSSASAVVLAGTSVAVNRFLGSASTAMLDRVADAAMLPAGAPVRLRSALVVGGTDVFPGRLYVADDPALGPLLRVDLAAAPVVAFQPGDIVALQGLMGGEGGERAVIGAAARLVGMRAPWDERAGPLPAAGGANPCLASVEGRVVDSAPGLAILEVTEGARPGTRVEVVLVGRKLPGVEDVETALPAPPTGQYAHVTGLLTATPRAGGDPLLRLRPRVPEEVVYLPMPLAARVSGAARWLAVPALFGVIAWQRRRHAPR